MFRVSAGLQVRGVVIMVRVGVSIQEVMSSEV